jgi:hypothetical protein
MRFLLAALPEFAAEVNRQNGILGIVMLLMVIPALLINL